MISCNRNRGQEGLTLLEVVITIGILAFLLLVMYAAVISIGFRMRLELVGSHLAPGSKSPVNQQVIVDQVERFFLEVSRNVRNASAVEVEDSLIRVKIEKDGGGIDEIEYHLGSYPVDATTVKAIVRTVNGAGKTIMVQGVEDFTVRREPQGGSLRFVTLELKVSVGEAERTFSINLLGRNPLD